MPATIERVEYGVCSDLSATHRTRGTVEVISHRYHEGTEAEKGKELAICEHPKRRKALRTLRRSGTSPSTGTRAGNNTVPYNQTTTPPWITTWPIARVRTTSPWHRLYVWDCHRERRTTERKKDQEKEECKGAESERRKGMRSEHKRGTTLLYERLPNQSLVRCGRGLTVLVTC